MESFSALPALCKSPVTAEFPSRRTSNAGFDVFFDVSLNKQLRKQLRAGDLRRHVGYCDVTVMDTRTVYIISGLDDELKSRQFYSGDSISSIEMLKTLFTLIEEILNFLSQTGAKTGKLFSISVSNEVMLTWLNSYNR